MDELTTVVIAAQQGDKAAFTQIVLRFQDMAYATAYAMLHEAGLAQDAAQEAFIDAYLSLPNLREPAAFPGWFRRIIVKHADRQTRRWHGETVPLEQLADLRSPLPTPDVALELAQDQADVNAAIKALPPAQRLVTLLFYIEGYSQQAIADYLEVPLTAVKKRLFNARQSLKERMIDQMQHLLQSNRPSQNEQFASKVAFFIAVKANDLHQVAALLQRDPALVHAVTEWGMEPLGYYAPVGVTALHWAAGIGNQALIETLLVHGADINAQTQPGKPTPLHEAIQMVQPDMVMFLLAHGADPNSVAYTGQTPLHLAVHRNTSVIAQYLLDAGGALAAKDQSSRTPLDWACLYGRTAIADLLTARGAQSAVPIKLMATPVLTPEQPRLVPVGRQLLGRLLDSEGHPLDGSGPLTTVETAPIYRPVVAVEPPILATGIKIIDLFAPLKRGGHNALFSPMAGLGRMVLLSQLAYSMHSLHNGYTVVLGLERQGYTAEDRMLYWRENGPEPQMVGARMVNVFARSHDEATKKLHAAETSLTIAEALRVAGHNVLLLVDAELALAEGVASYLRTNTVATPAAAITTLYWGDYTVGSEPAPLAGLDAALALERWRAQHGLHPAVDPLRSRSVLVETGVVSREHHALAMALRRGFARYAELDPVVEQGGEDVLAALNDPQTVLETRRIRRVHRFLTQPLPGLEFFTGLLGVHVNVADVIAGCRAILAGEVDALPEEAFYMVGTLAQVTAKAQTL